MAKKLMLAVVALLAGCGDNETSSNPGFDVGATATLTAQEIAPVETESAADIAERERYYRIEEVRQANPAINWMNVGISTGKFSESLSVEVFQTYGECVEASYSEDNECAPIAALPKSYWNAKDPGLKHPKGPNQ